MEVPRILDYKTLEEMTNGFSEERELGRGAYGKVYLGVDKDGGKIAVKVLYDMPALGDKQFDKEFQNLITLQHRNIVRLVGYCHETQRECVPFEGRMILADVTKRALCFDYMQNGGLDKYISDEHTGDGWQKRYAIIKGICNGLKYLHEEQKPSIFHLDLKPANILLDANMIPKIADFGLSGLFGDEQTRRTNSVIGTIGYLPPEYINRNVISNKLDIFSLGVVLIKIMTGHAGYSLSAEIPSDEFVERIHGNWRTRLRGSSVDALESCCEQVKRCIQIALRCVEVDRHSRPTIGEIVNMLNETESMIQSPDALANLIGSSMDQMWLGTSNTSEWLDVHPLKLHFPFEPNKLISCRLHLTNKTYGDHVAFRCLPKNPKTYFYGLSNLHGILPPRSSCTYIVTMKMQQEPPADMDALTVIVENCIGHKDMQQSDVDDFFFMGVREDGAKVHEVTLMAVSDTPTKMMASQETLRPQIEIINTSDYGPVLSVDVHPTESCTHLIHLVVLFSMGTKWHGHINFRIMASHLNAHVSIWNYQSQTKVMAERVTNVRKENYMGNIWINTAKFIGRKQWFVAGDMFGYIYVYSCTTMGKLKEIKAHTGGIESIAIHPSDPFMLSSSSDNLVKLWNWKTGWECIQTFRGHTHHVKKVMFNPQNDNTFASVSSDGTIKIWNILSPVPITSLDFKGEQQICVDYFPTGCDLQYMVTASARGTARIWDLQTQRCIRHLRGLQRECGCSIFVVHDHSILVTVSSDYAVSMCNSTTYRQEKTFDFKLGRVRGFAYIKGIRSLVVGTEDGIVVMEII